MSHITIKGARQNNLKNVDLLIPRNKVVCFMGVSGSGKSTIAFDIIAREGQRQYFESLPAFARRYLQKSSRPDVEEIKGLSSTVIINQERVAGSPRSTVGTLTETYTYLRMLYSQAGMPSLDSSFYSFNHPYGACPRCKGLGKVVTLDPNKLINFDKSLSEGAFLHSEWQVGGRMWSIIKATGYFDMNKKIKDFEKEQLEKLLYAPKQLWQDKSEYGANKWTYQGIITRLSGRDRHDKSELGYLRVTKCDQCKGGRLNSQALSVVLGSKNIGEVANMSLVQCLDFVQKVNLPQARVIKPRLVLQLQNLINAGVGYLSLNRSTDTLSGGEAQRVKLARQIGSDLIETIYVLDEPTAGLHPRDIERVITNLRKLRDSGNTVLVVEHDKTVIESADHLIEVGPGGGKNGGEIIAQGSLKDIVDNRGSVSAAYLKKSKSKQVILSRAAKGMLPIKSANINNLKNISIDIPLQMLVALTGVSGSGKSSLVEEIIDQHLKKVVVVDQSPVGNNKRGCIGTYTGILDLVRKIFAQHNKVSSSLFSFNSQGACNECKGLGHIDMEMNFLGSVMIDCESCHGKRFKDHVLEYQYKGKNIAEVLTMTASEINEFFNNDAITSKVDLLLEVGLDYVEMAQSLDTLSGGESQRLKLASRLQCRGEFYILDEPTSGLHFADIEKLMKLINRLVDQGNTVLVIEHNLDVIAQADHIIDLGPEGGDKGGKVVVQGALKKILESKESYTGQHLRKYFEQE